MDSYETIFNLRGHDYNSASDISPKARLEEIDHLISLTTFSNSSSILDIPAGGGVVASRIKSQVESKSMPYNKIHCVEPSIEFARAIPQQFNVSNEPIDDTKLSDNSFDMLFSLAGLHHCQNRLKIYKHWYSLLKKNGQFIVADVLEGTTTAEFLNGFVDKYNSMGHQGDFIRKHEFNDALTDIGFKVEYDQLDTVPWKFDNKTQLGQFCQRLFSIDKATVPTVINALENTVGIKETEYQVSLMWQLQYAKAVKV